MQQEEQEEAKIYNSEAMGMGMGIRDSVRSRVSEHERGGGGRSFSEMTKDIGKLLNNAILYVPRTITKVLGATCGRRGAREGGRGRGRGSNLGGEKRREFRAPLIQQASRGRNNLPHVRARA